MTLGGKKEAWILLLGDLLCFVVALWLMLAIRHLSMPDWVIFRAHFLPFSAIFALWVLVYFISDLYRKQTLIFSGPRLPSVILRAQAINSLLAGLFFYFLPYYRQIGLTPRLNLLLLLVITFGLVLTWRRYLAPLVLSGRSLAVQFDCEGLEVSELMGAMERSPHYRFRAVKENPDILVYDKYDPETFSGLTELYQRFFRGVRFVAVQDLYEDVFGRVPITLINEEWFFERVSNQPKPVYDAFKRVMDVAVAGVLGLLSLLFYPLIILAIKLDDGGPVFFADERVGSGGRLFKVHKFRSMSTETELPRRRVTRVGRFLRRLRLDELPQLWGVVLGYQSLIGPRPEKSDYVKLYRGEIPFYDARHLIAPGLSGWAQIYQEGHPHFSTSALATSEKLSYDLYYIKNRSLWLDITIGLKTIKILLSRKGI